MYGWARNATKASKIRKPTSFRNEDRKLRMLYLRKHAEGLTPKKTAVSVAVIPSNPWIRMARNAVSMKILGVPNGSQSCFE